MSDNIYKYNNNDFRKIMQELAGIVFSYKSEHGCVWQVGKRHYNKHKLRRAYNQQFFEQRRIALKHFTIVQNNFKITNRNGSTRWLIYIDFDTKKGLGSPVDVQRFFKFLSENYFPDLQYVQNERGGGAWLVVDNILDRQSRFIKRVQPTEWNDTIKAFGKWLEQVAKDIGCQFSEVSAYGTLAEPVMGNREVIDVKTDNHFLFKCPPGLEFIKTKIGFVQLDEVMASRPMPAAPVVPATPAKKMVGSSFERAEEQIEHVRKEIMSDNTRPTFVMCGRKRRHITARMCAEYMHAISCLRPNEDGTMPRDRVLAFISTMYQRGVYEHGADPACLKAVRDWMSSKNGLKWKDNTYERQRACKWEMCPVLREKIRNTSSLSFFRSTVPTDNYLKPQWRQKKTLPDGWQDTIDQLYGYKMAA